METWIRSTSFRRRVQFSLFLVLVCVIVGMLRLMNLSGDGVGGVASPLDLKQVEDNPLVSEDKKQKQPYTRIKTTNTQHPRPRDGAPVCSRSDGRAHRHPYPFSSINSGSIAVSSTTTTQRHSKSSKGKHSSSRGGIMEETSIAIARGVRVVTHFVRSSQPPSRDQVTIVTTASMSTLWHIVRLASVWDGPISCSLHIPGNQQESITLVSKFVQEHLSSFHSVILHLIMDERDIVDATEKTGLTSLVADALNVAMDAAETRFILPIDTQFLPSPNLFSRLDEVLLPDSAWASALEYEKAAIGLPAFTLKGGGGGGSREEAKDWVGVDLLCELDALLREDGHGTGLLRQIKSLSREVFDPDMPGTSRSLMEEWMNISDFLILEKETVVSFVVVSKKNGLLPRFFKTFETSESAISGWIEELKTAGFTFHVDPTSFVVKSSDLRSDDGIRKKELSQEVGNQFKDYLASRYSNKFSTGPAIHPVESSPCSHPLTRLPVREVDLCLNGSWVIPSWETVLRGSIQLEDSMHAFGYAMRTSFVPERADITMTVQLSKNKWSRLLLLTHRWHGPISAAIYIRRGKSEFEEFVAFVLRNSRQFSKTVFHLGLAEDTYKADYPINVMRNLALDSIETDYAFPNDIDFIPSIDMHARLWNFLTREPRWKNRVRHEKYLLVAPAFEQFLLTGDEDDLRAFRRLPTTKKDLNSSIIQNRVQVFKGGEAHALTDTPKWLTLPENASAYEVEGRIKGYEPYFLVEKYHGTLPRFEKAFKGYAFNKSSWVLELHAAGYRFAVLPDVFLIHMNHDYGYRSYKDGRARKPETDELHASVKQRIKDTYG